MFDSDRVSLNACRKVGVVLASVNVARSRGASERASLVLALSWSCQCCLKRATNDEMDVFRGEMAAGLIGN